MGYDSHAQDSKFGKEVKAWEDGSGEMEFVPCEPGILVCAIIDRQGHLRVPRGPNSSSNESP